MKKFGLLSLVLAGVAFTVVGCASEAGFHESGSAQTSATPETTTQTSATPETAANAVVQADASAQTQPVQASPEVSQVGTESTPVQ